MKYNTLKQVILFAIGIILVALTYFIYPQQTKNKNFEETKIITKLEKELNFENTFEDISYNGSDKNGNLFQIGSKFAEIKKDDPDITYMTEVVAYFYLTDGRTVKVTSKFGTYNKLTNDMFFEENVRMTEAENELRSDYLDAIASESFLTAYNNVKFSNDESIGFADKVKVDLTTKLSQISMYDGEEKIYIIYNK